MLFLFILFYFVSVLKYYLNGNSWIKIKKKRNRKQFRIVLNFLIFHFTIGIVIINILIQHPCPKSMIFEFIKSFFTIFLI
jgi:hypothetical protein